MRFETPARFITLEPETLDEALTLWAKCELYRHRRVIRAQPQPDGHVKVFIDLAATANTCLFPEEEGAKRNG